MTSVRNKEKSLRNVNEKRFKSVAPLLKLEKKCTEELDCLHLGKKKILHRIQTFH